MSSEINLLEHTLENTFNPSLASRKKEIKRIIEALLFSCSEPLSFQKMKEIIDSSYPVKSEELKQLIEELKFEYHAQQRSFQLDEIAGGYLLRTVIEMQPYIELLFQEKRGEKLSKAAMEVLAIIAYKQPITRQEIEKIRGVDSSGIVSSLSERNLIESVGRLEAPGRPTQYAVTKTFLKYFGLNHLKDLQKP